LAGSGRIQRNPADAVYVEFGPAMIAGNAAYFLTVGESESDLQARRDACGASHVDEQCVKTGAIAATGIAGLGCVAMFRADAVVTACRDYIFKKLARLLKRIRDS